MHLQSKARIILNPYFHSVFLLWVSLAGSILAISTRIDIFKFINSHNTEATDRLFFLITYMGQPEVIIPTLIALMLLPQFRHKWYFFTGVACNISPLIIQQVLKKLFHHDRPFRMFSQDHDWIHFASYWTKLVGNNSFPSGHSQGAFSFFCFLSLLLPARYRMFGLLFGIFAVAVCYSRVYLAAHFFDDVFFGSIVGAVTTTLLFSLMNKYHPVTAEL